MFHKHNWEEKDRFYAPPVQKGRIIGDIEDDAMERLLNRLYLGMTTIIYRCECSEIKKVEILGEQKR